MRKLLGWCACAGLTLLIAASASCKDNEILAELKSLGEECFLDSDCKDPLICVFGSCHVECQTDPDCVEAAATFDVHPRCVVGDKPSNVCLNADEVECGVETDGTTVLSTALCPGELWCGPDGECRSRCSSAIDCVAGQLCVQGSCASPDELDENGLLSDPATSTQGVPCSYHSECVAPLVCRNQVCSEQCLGDVDCPEGYLCVVDDSVEILGPVRVCRKPGGGGAAHCNNLTLDEDETDVDCGGSCAPCGTGSPCDAPSDCINGSCDEICLPAACDDSVRNGLETDVDCGGPDCALCPDGSTCASQSDCDGATTCFENVCVGPDCLNGTLDGSETDVDCGGPDCGPCGAGEGCVIAGDCTDLVCAAFSCVDGSCIDGVKNNAESAVDCGGGGCQACPVGAPCTTASQCETGACSAGGFCAAPSCTDGAQNGLEPAIDCGGICPNACLEGQGCIDDGDCTGGTLCKPGLTSQCTATVTLTIAVAGNGNGSVTSDPTGISYPSAPSGEFFPGDPVTLSATPSPTSTLTGWSACGGVGDCDVIVNAPLTVTATFTSPVATFASGGSTDNPFATPDGATAFDASGNVYMASSLFSNTDFGSFSLQRISAPMFGNDATLVKFSASGTPLWGVNFADAGTEAQFRARAVVVTASGQAVVAVEAPTSFFVGAQFVTCPAQPGNKLALVRFNPDGSGAVGVCFGSNIFIRDAVIAADGDMLVVGSFEGTVDFGGGPPLVSSGGTPDAFLARYDTGSFALVEARDVAGDGMTTAQDIARDAAGTSFLISSDCTSASGTTDFGNGVLLTRPANFESEICTVRLNNQLDAVWAYGAGGPDPDIGFASAFLSNGVDVAVVGSFQAGVDFGDGVPIRQAGSSPDLAILRVNAATGVLQPSPSVIWYQNAGAPARSASIDGAGGPFHVGVGDFAFTPSFDINGTTASSAFLLSFDNFNATPAPLLGGNIIADLRVGPQGQIAFFSDSGPWGAIGAATSGIIQLLP